MDMDRVLFSATTSASHIFGNITQSMKMYLQSRMPVGMLKGVGISSASPFRYYNKYMNSKTPFSKKEMPYMIIKPSFEIISANDDSFLNNVALTRFEGTCNSAVTQEFMHDYKNGFALGFTINRYRVSFEVGIQFNTYYHGIDIYQYLQNSMKWELPEYIPTMLESNIPKELMMRVGECAGIDIRKDENIPTFMRYMQEKSTYPVTFKMRNSTSTDEYFLFYHQDVLTTFSDLTLEDVQKKGAIEDMAVVMFKATCDFNVMGTYRMLGHKRTFKQIDFCLHSRTDDGKVTLGGYVPIYTYNRLYDETPLLERGYSKVNTTIIKTEIENNHKDDVFEMKCILEPTGQMLIREMVAHSEPVNMLYEMILICNDDPMTEGIDYNVNWTNMTITIHNSDKSATYRLLLYVNLLMYNDRAISKQNITTDQQTIDSNTRKGYQL